MLRIDGKERLLSTTFTMMPGETADYTPPELGGGKIIFMIQPEATPQPRIVGSADGTTITLSLPRPYENSVGCAWQDAPGIATGPDGQLSGRVAVQLCGDIILVHFEAYLSRTPSYRPR